MEDLWLRPRFISKFMFSKLLYNHFIFRTAADVIGLATARKSSLGDSADSGSDEAPKTRGFNVPTFYPRERDITGLYQEKVKFFPRDGSGLGGHCGVPAAGPIGSGRPGLRSVWPGA